ncbi:unnamed protein product, partial [Mesorhabditis spiculigera]
MPLSFAPYAPHRIFRSFRLLIGVGLCFTLLLVFRLGDQSDPGAPRFPPQQLPDFICPCNETKDDENYEPTAFASDEIFTESKALVLVESIYSRHSKIITQILNASKYPYKMEVFAKNLPLLTTLERGRFSTVIIESYHKYLNMPRWNRQILDKYCREYNATIVGILTSRPNDTFKRAKLKGSSLSIWQNQQATSFTFSPSSPIPYIARPSVPINNPAEEADWVLFEESAGYETVLEGEAGHRRGAAVIRDLGNDDGVRRILFGHNITSWVTRMAFLDSLRFATQGRFGFPLERWIQVDIDDIFVGAKGTRIVAEDVDALIEFQDWMRSEISNFTFMLGYSGSYFRNGNDDEDLGDEKLIENGAKFHWFCHMWRHNHAHDYNYTYLESVMSQNKQFAETMKLPVPFPYSISPQHAGVFPAHAPLYDAWKKIWNVSVTATEEYPHLRPPSDRRGFIHKGIKVLPRQTCGLYTHTQFFHTYPDGLAKLFANVYGGELFSSVLLNPISIFMTHQQNFAHDRLALWVFRNLVKFLKCHTRLKLRWADPITSADRYFAMFPQEVMPVWSHPCVDPRHKTILPPAFNCSNITLPNILIVGPQKTGSSALGNFLSLHPDVSSNVPVSDSFEELQFFGGHHYGNGLEWYIDKFSPSQFVFEKSATYFDNALAPRQVAALIPNTKIIVILYDPALRAYSWFQHMLAHRDPTAVEAQNLDVVLDATVGPMKKLRSRCVSGGRYVHHIDRWLDFFPASQLLFIDGENFKERPPEIMNKLILDLAMPAFDYRTVLRFSPSKGYWCTLTQGKTKCLGKSKGRHYAPMSDVLRQKLNGIFHADNLALQKLLQKWHIPQPAWLRAALDAQ